MIHPLFSLLAPKTIAVFGPVAQPGSQAYDWWHLLQNGSQSLVGVSSHQSQATEYKHMVSSLSQSDIRPDLAVIASPDWRQAVIECEYAGVPVALLAGKKPTESLPGSGKTRLLWPGAFGYMRPSQSISLSSIPLLPQGNVAIVGQSGLVSSHLASAICQDSVGCSFFAIDRHQDIGLDELLWLLEADDKTEVIGLQIESIQNDRPLLEALARISPKKPVVMLTKTDFGTKSAEYLPLYLQAGAIITDSIKQFTQLVRALADNSQTKFSHKNDGRHWRYATAMHSLSGLPTNFELKPEHTSPASQLHVFKRDHTSPGKSVSALLDAGPVSRIAQAWPYLGTSVGSQSEVSLSSEVKLNLRNHILKNAHNNPNFPPFTLDLFNQAGIPTLSGAWLDVTLPVDLQQKQLGWPLVVWGLTEDDQIIKSKSIVTRQRLLETTRRMAGKCPKIWLQPLPTDGLELDLTTQRHEALGPILTMKAGGIMATTHQVSHLLPLSADRVDLLLAQVGICDLDRDPHLRSVNSRAVSQTIQSIGRLTAEMSEIRKIQASITISNGRAAITNASLQLEPML